MTRAQDNPGNFAQDRERAAEAGHKGGQHSGGGGGAEHNRGNFAQDRERAAEAGHKGGQHSGGDRR
ncbi:MAG: general stress protein [Alphaproteobacteria bacterium]|nr:general stress protein [Alphaproteobacteria bacterium]